MSKEKTEKISRVIFQEGGIQVLASGVKNSMDSVRDKCEFELKPGILIITSDKIKTMVPLSHVKQMDYLDL